jgi:hypothetical protein
MSQCIVFCRTNVDCNALEEYLNSYSAGGGRQGFRGKVESGKENKYSCCVLAGELGRLWCVYWLSDIVTVDLLSQGCGPWTSAGLAYRR